MLSYWTHIHDPELNPCDILDAIPSDLHPDLGLIVTCDYNIALNRSRKKIITQQDAKILQSDFNFFQKFMISLKNEQYEVLENNYPNLDDLYNYLEESLAIHGL